MSQSLGPRTSPSGPLSYVGTEPHSPWQTYLQQVDRVIPYLGDLARWAD